MSFALMRKAITLYSNPDNSREQNRRMQRQWLRSMEFLGDKHILNQKAQRVTESDPRLLK